MEAFKTFDLTADAEGYLPYTKKVDIDPGEKEFEYVQMQQEEMKFDISLVLFFSFVMSAAYMLYEESKHGKKR